MEKEQLTQSLLNRRKTIRADKTTRLCEVLERFMVGRVRSQYKKFGRLPQVWSELLPAELAGHCSIGDISNGTLKVLVDSSAYMYELRLCSGDLLKQLQFRCPRARLQKIRFVMA
jgi:hypothetical protein